MRPIIDNIIRFFNQLFETLGRSCTIYRVSFAYPEELILDTKEAILKKARKLFAKHGYDGVSIRTICDKIPCNVSAISYHFGSKEGLYSECFRIQGNDVQAIISKVLTEPENLEDFKSKLSLFLIQFFEHSFKNRETILIIGKDVGSKSAMESIEKIFKDIPDGITSFLQAAQERKILKKELTPNFVCSFLIDPLFMQILFLEHTKAKRNFSDPHVRQNFVEELLAVFFDGIL